MSGDDGIYSKPPPHDFNMVGLSALGQYRIRPTWFGCVLEECWQSEDGSRFWQRSISPVPIPYQGQARPRPCCEPIASDDEMLHRERNR